MVREPFQVFRLLLLLPFYLYLSPTKMACLFSFFYLFAPVLCGVWLLCVLSLAPCHLAYIGARSAALSLSRPRGVDCYFVSPCFSFVFRLVSGLVVYITYARRHASSQTPHPHSHALLRSPFPFRLVVVLRSCMPPPPAPAVCTQLLRQPSVSHTARLHTAALLRTLCGRLLPRLPPDSFTALFGF